MRRKKEDAEQTRKAILASAMDIFYEKGYSKTTFDEIAKRINLTKGAVYWYFRNKPDIVAALINEYISGHLQSLKNFQSEEIVEFSDIVDMALHNNRQIKENTQIYKYLFFITCQMEWSEAIINKIQPSIEETKQITRSLFSEILQKLQKSHKIRPEVDVNMICEILMCMYGGMMEAYFTKRLNHDFDEVVKNGFNLIFNSIKTEDVKDEN